MSTAADRLASASSVIDDLVTANRILYRQKVVDGFGHVSARHPLDPERFLLSQSKAPGTVEKSDILVYGLDGEVIDAQGRRLYLERYIHSAIYAARPDVMSVVHSHSPAVIPFGIAGVPMRPVMHVCGFLGAHVPVFEIRDAAGPASDLLIRSQQLGNAMARVLGDAPVVLMRGHGSTAVADSIPLAVYRAVYTEVNARIEADALRLGPVNFLTPEEAAAAAATNAGPNVLTRIWELWKSEAQDAS
ncbi:MAG TPA: class II aldolase/adducin family protein [Casimicrobiaceae bacterium]|nr:class II aldolase/adducin family protein [Casimicrobiaceae bacterium]